ncbi:hypothetical protein MIDIC_590002 [Alphaproteobacteria bacterium]
MTCFVLDRMITKRMYYKFLGEEISEIDAKSSDIIWSNEKGL